MSKEKDQIFCSLDIETSGFDPEKNEILEVGFVFFTFDDNLSLNPSPQKERGIRIVEEWTKVFKPEKEVPSSILGLTGITKEELENGADFEEFKDFLRKKLGNATIVGHNVIFDIKFLESKGLKFSGGVLDTLDLVQFILPTHHSYNLENLMHKFSVPHKDAHRALADCKATLSLLEKLLGVFQNFPEKLKSEMIAIADSASLPWGELLKIKLPPFVLEKSSAFDVIPSGTRNLLSTEYRLRNPSDALGMTPYGQIKLENKRIYSFPAGKNCLNDLVSLLTEQNKKILLVVPKQSQVMALWKQGKAEAAFAPEMMFNPKKFAALQKSKNLNLEEAKFLLKILVWQKTNWQSKTILDLNFSFFGGQFKNLINGGQTAGEMDAKIVCADLAAFTCEHGQGLDKNRFTIIAGLSEFETAVSFNISVKVSWTHIVYILKSFYNPGLGAGNAKFKGLVEEGMIAADLFFGIVNAFFQTDPPTFRYVKFPPEMFEEDKLKKIKFAAENFAQKLEKINQSLNSGGVAEFIKNLAGFFGNQENHIKWAELAQGRCVLYSSPLDITKLAQKLLKPFSQVAFADSLGTEKLQKYFSARLGLSGFVSSPVEPKTKTAKQLMLFNEKIVGNGKKGKNPDSQKPLQSQKIACYCQSRTLPYHEIAEILDEERFPAAVLFGGGLQMKEFHENNYQNLKQKAFLHAQSQTGGSSKIFHNFSIHKNSLLLATDKFILKSINSLAAMEPVETLAVKTLILCHLPFEQYTHPYQEALAEKFNNPFEDFSLPKAVYNLHRILQFFNTPLLETVYICDSKLAKGYASAFKDYIKLIPNMEMIEI